MQFQQSLRLAARLAPPVALVGLTIAVSCSRDSYLDPTAPSHSVVGTADARALTTEHRDRLNAAKARTRWVGDAHHAGMQVIIKNIAQHRKAKRALPKRGSTEYCAIIERVGDATVEVLDQHRGVHRSQSERVAFVRQDRSVARCSGTLAVFGLPRSTSPVSLLTAQASDPEVTGAYEDYLDPMDAAVQGSNGSVVNVQARLDAVLAQAVSAGIPEGDLLALTSFAGLAVSSAEEWNTFDWSGLGGGNTTDGGYTMSVFALGRRDDRALGVIGADVGACLSSVKGWRALKLLLVGPAWGALAGECGLRAAIGSGGAILAMM